MGFLDFLKGLFGPPRANSYVSRTRVARSRGEEAVAPGSLALEELARRLDMPEDELRTFQVAYREYQLPKRSGGKRSICAPEPPLRDLQRRILRRLLGKLKVHPAATGFERGHSIVTHASFHANQDLVMRLDIRDFFTTTSAGRIENYFRKIGWNAEAASLLTRLTTWKGGLPQGAPTSPRLSNLVNYRLDARLEGLGRSISARYSRYADDLTFSFGTPYRWPFSLAAVVRGIVDDFGYCVHTGKTRVQRRHRRQKVTGLIVNDGQPRLPRETRRRLRAVKHHLATGQPATLTPEQLKGWESLQSMIDKQTQR